MRTEIDIEESFGKTLERVTFSSLGDQCVLVFADGTFTTLEATYSALSELKAKMQAHWEQRDRQEYARLKDMKIEGIPDGYEVVRWGKPNGYDEYWMEGHQVACGPSNRDVLIIRKIGPVLDLSKVRLRKGWIAQDKNGLNCWYDRKPLLLLHEDSWTACESSDFAGLGASVIDIPWREDVPWTERIMEITE